MLTRLIIILISSLIFTGCIPYFLFSPVERDARNHMKQATSHEKEGRFDKAEQDYANIVEKYPETSYKKDAVLKLVSLKINTVNTQPDYSDALELMKAYSDLSLTLEEKQVADGYISLLRRIVEENGTHQKYRLSIQKQKEQKKKMKKELELYKTKTKELEDKLQKLKDIDVQMHENRRKQRQ